MGVDVDVDVDENENEEKRQLGQENRIIDDIIRKVFADVDSYPKDCIVSHMIHN